MKLISILLAFSLLISLCACRKADTTLSSTNGETSSKKTSLETSSLVEDIESTDSQAQEDNSSLEDIEVITSETSSIEEDVESVDSKIEDNSSLDSEDTTTSDISSSEENLSSKTDKNTSSKNVSSKANQKKCKHKFSAVMVQATCKSEGHLTKTCKLCGYVEKKVIKPKKHVIISGQCANCGYNAAVDSVATVAQWVKTNANGEYHLSDKRYYIKTLGESIIFYFDGGAQGLVKISLYALEEKLCYIEYRKEETLEGNIPMDLLHSSNRVYFENMSGVSDETLKTQMVSELIWKIDGILTTFDTEIKNKMNVSINDMGFAWY